MILKHVDMYLICWTWTDAPADGLKSVGATTSAAMMISKVGTEYKRDSLLKTNKDRAYPVWSIRHAMTTQW